MLLITEATLIEYTKQHPEATASLLRWAALTKAAVWRNLVETRRTFSHADAVYQCTVFNIKGNDYRLIARIEYGLQTITLKHFLTHTEYNRDKWKKYCHQSSVQSQEVCGTVSRGRAARD